MLACMRMEIAIRPIYPPIATEVLIGKDLLQKEELLPLCKKFGTKIGILADAKVAELYAKQMAEELNGKVFVLPSGEEAKTMKTCEKIVDELLQNGFGKTSVLIALGGGATTDAAGFIASIYLRGVALILIPTTLLAMVDAAFGGKTAIDTSFGKNLLGTLYHPKAVVIDLKILEFLPQKQWQNGLAEIRKIGLVYRPEIWTQDQGDALVIEAIKAKISVIEQDPNDTGIRRILNFGHTIGHGLEKLSGYQLPHGQAVAIGSVAASHLSMQLGYLATSDFEKIVKAYGSFSLHLPENYSRNKLLDTMAHDKKAIDQAIHFVLIDRIGHAVEFGGTYCRPVNRQELEPTLEWMEQWLCK